MYAEYIISDKVGYFQPILLSIHSTYSPIIAPNFLLWTFTGLLWTIAVNVHNREGFKEKVRFLQKKFPETKEKRLDRDNPHPAK